MQKAGLLGALAALCLVPTLTWAQDGYFASWFARGDKTKDEQPHWVTPLATTTPRLEEEYRYDQLWQTNAKGMTTEKYDGGKGLELIPFEKVEVIFNVPPYLVHNDPAVLDGFGDVAFLVKYRLLSANEEHGSYILTAFLGWSLPTGAHKNGALHAVITPTIAYGKGFGNFDLQGTFGVGLPTADTTLTGRNYAWNNTFQYRVFRKFWPEVEINSTFFQDGFALSHFHGQSVRIMGDAGAAILLLIVNATLSVFKPRGLTPHGTRVRHQEEVSTGRANEARPEEPIAPQWVKAFVVSGLVTLLLFGLVFGHFSGGVGHHGR